jgi:hypothetical protein
MDGQVPLAVLQAPEGFGGSVGHVFHRHVPKDDKTGWVGVPGHALAGETLGQDVQGGMFKPVIATGA